MLRLLHKRQLWRFTSSLRDQTTATTTAACLPPSSYLFPQRHYVKHISPTSSAPTNDPSLTVRFLECSCGLSSEAALVAAEKFKLIITGNSESVLALLEDYGFSKAQITRLITELPQLLRTSPDKTLRPKFEFFLLELGMSNVDLSEMLLKCPKVLSSSVENTLRPNLRVLKFIFQDEEMVRDAVKGSPGLLPVQHPILKLSSIEALKNHGVTEPVIVALLLLYPHSGMKMVRSFEETIQAIKEMRISPSSKMFAYAFKVFSVLPESVWERRLENFRSLGWSKEQVLNAFIKWPNCMACSDEKTRKSFLFFTEKLKWELSYLSDYPVVLGYSFEKRILPRCLILGILASKGLLKSKVGAQHFMLGETSFLKKYVIKYEKEVPELLRAMGGSDMKLGGLQVKDLGLGWIDHLQSVR